jgi:hypothetical protein
VSEQQKVAIWQVPPAYGSAWRRAGGYAGATVETGIDGRRKRSSFRRMIDDQDVYIVASAHGRWTKN